MLRPHPRFPTPRLTGPRRVQAASDCRILAGFAAICAESLMRLLALLLFLLPGALAAEPLRVAVAANFRNTLETLADAWVANGGEALKISSASTGVLYNQALYGAPFDLLLAADSDRPRRLVDSGHAVADSRVTSPLPLFPLRFARCPLMLSSCNARAPRA